MGKLNSRQTYILQLISAKQTSMEDLVRRLHVSRRTIQRDISVLREYLKAYRINLDASQSAIRVVGSAEDVAAATPDSGRTATLLADTSESRALFAVLELLSTNGPLKLSYIARVLGVTSSSISHDLNSVTAYLRSYKLRLIRRPGYGVEIVGDAMDKTEAIAELVHGQLPIHDLMSILRGTSEMAYTNPVQAWMSSFFSEERLSEVRTVVCEELADMSPPLDEAALFGFILHVLLTCLRIESQMPLTDIQSKEGLDSETEICTRILKKLLGEESALHVEAMYLARHLRGAKVQMTEETRLLPQNMTAMDLAFQISRQISDFLTLPLADDRALLVGLAQHLEPALYRIRTGLPIRNPLLQQVQERYPNYFEAVRVACNQVLRPYNFEVPDAEIGYLTMHLGAAIERLKPHHTWRVKIVCPNGISSAELLASRMRSEFPQVRIIGVNSIEALDETDCDLVVSTVPTLAGSRPVITVSPFLTDDDVRRVQNSLRVLEDRGVTQQNGEEGRLLESDLSQLAEDIANQVEVYTSAPATIADLVALVARKAVVQGDAETEQPIVLAIEERERLGSIVLPGKRLAVLHARLSEIKRCHVGVHRLQHPLPMRSVGPSVEPVDTVLVILARIQEDAAVIELLGRLSASIVMDSSTVDTLRSRSKSEIRERIYDALNQTQE